jgi:diguanylate cyclase (GGDEF)-like protein
MSSACTLATCSLLLVNEAGSGFQIGAAPHTPDYFNTAVLQLQIGIGAGTCGEAAATGHLVVAEDLKTHPNWSEHQELVHKTGFLSCWSQPVFSSTGVVLGTFASYRKERYAPDQEHIKAIENAANLVSIVIERKALEAQVQQLAFYDSLTMLPNRYLFMDRLQIAMIASKRSGRYGALIFIDLDSLKELNDAFGHHYGDLLLTETAKRLRDSVREVDTVARYGGDEFMVILGDMGTDRTLALEQAKLLAEKLLTALAIPYLFPR